MNGDQVKVHAIAVSETVLPTLTGAFKRVTIVRYFIGDHGPFQDQYPSDQATEAAIRAGIEARLRTLRGLSTQFPGV